MKRLLLLTAALAVVTSALAQQDKQDKTFTYGPKIGLNFADMHFDMGDNDSSGGLKPALVIGGFAEYRICTWFAVSADALYSRQGYKLEESVWMGDGDRPKATYSIDYRLQYIDIPLLANFYVTDGLALKTGIQAGFLLGADRRLTVDGEFSNMDIKKAFQSTELTIPVGLSYTFGMGLMIDLRYNIPVTNIATDVLKAESAENGAELSQVKNHVFALSLGWKF